jgi:hypothetical protein
METAEQHWDLLNEDILGMNPELVLITYALDSICMFISDCLMQSLLDMMKHVGTGIPEMTFFSLPEMIARTLSQRPGRFAIIWQLRRAVLANFANLFKEWIFFRNWSWIYKRHRPEVLLPCPWLCA